MRLTLLRLEETAPYTSEDLILGSDSFFFALEDGTGSHGESRILDDSVSPLVSHEISQILDQY